MDLRGPQTAYEHFLLSKAERCQHEARLLHSNGCRVWVRLTVSRVQQHQSGGDFVICMLEDITEGKQAQVYSPTIGKQLLLGPTGSWGVPVEGGVGSRGPPKSAARTHSRESWNIWCKLC